MIQVHAQNAVTTTQGGDAVAANEWNGMEEDQQKFQCLDSIYDCKRASISSLNATSDSSSALRSGSTELSGTTSGGGLTGLLDNGLDCALVSSLRRRAETEPDSRRLPCVDKLSVSLAPVSTSAMRLTTMSGRWSITTQKGNFFVEASHV